MFTGIIEAIGTIESKRQEGSNIHFTLNSPFTAELKVDESVAHDGVCLTVTAISENRYTVTAIEETLLKTNLKHWNTGRSVNLERAMIAGARLDGHMVQGHVDGTGICTQIDIRDGSWYFSFEHENGEHFTVPKGSICVNGVSLTVTDSSMTGFSVAIIPFTFAHTTFQHLNVGDEVNLEFDIIGKYISRYMAVFGKMTN